MYQKIVWILIVTAVSSKYPHPEPLKVFFDHDQCVHAADKVHGYCVAGRMQPRPVVVSGVPDR